VGNMAAKLINRTNEEQRSVVRCLWADGVPGTQINLGVCAQDGDKVVSPRIVYELLKCSEMTARL
jgi:hypothetical protein